MTVDGGYVKLYRKALHSPMWKNISLWRFWEWCLLKAEYKPTTTFVRYKEVALQPGQLIFGRRMAQKETGLSEQTIKTCVRTLSEGEIPAITIQTTRTHSIITILKWDDYQNAKTGGNPQATRQTTNFQPTANPQPTTYYKEEEVKEVKETHTSACEFSDASLSPLMERILALVREVKGVKSIDRGTRDGARELVLAVTAGDLDEKSLEAVVRAGLTDAKLPNQTLRGVARNFAGYLPKEIPRRKGERRRVVGWRCLECGHEYRQVWTIPDEPLPIQCQADGCKGRMELLGREENANG